MLFFIGLVGIGLKYNVVCLIDVKLVFISFFVRVIV